MIFKPRDYQQDVIAAILRIPRVSVWADMGLGKTAATLTAIDILQLHGDLDKPALILAPLLVATKTWPAEVRKWNHLQHMVVRPIVGTAKQRAAVLLRSADVYTMNYENLAWLLAHLGDKWPFGMVVCDESSKLKGFRSRQGTVNAKALGSVAHLPIVKRWVNLTGTPSANGLHNLWGQQWFVDAGAALGATYSAFTARWFQTEWNGYGVKPLPGAMEQITERLAPTTISLQAKDYLDIPQTIVADIPVHLPPPVLEQYKKFEREMVLEIGDDTDISAVNAAAKTVKCLQFANGAVYSETELNAYIEFHNAKIHALAALHDSIGKKPLLVVYNFAHDLERLLAAFPKGKKLNRDTLDKWNSGEIEMLFIHPKSAGHGLNLQDGGHHICFFAQDWDLELYQQVVERLGAVRQKQSGYDRPVFVYHLLAEGTLDADVVERRVTKRTVQQTLRDRIEKIRLDKNSC
jgi:hypothetical protein